MVEIPQSVTGAWLNSLTPDQKIEFLKSPLAKWLHDWAAAHVTYFWWMRRSLLGTTVLANGSVFFLDIGDKLFAVTARHVYDGFLADKAKSGSEIVCRVENLQFDPVSRVRGLRDGIDIVTFDFTYDELRKIGKHAVTAAASDWPPRHPFSGQSAFLAGFPGASRIWLSLREISFGLCVALQPVGNASDQSITLPFEREYWVDAMGRGLIPEGFNLGGISGAPLLIPIESDGSWSFFLGGVVSEAASKGFESVFCVPAHFIASDGSINDERSAPIRHWVPAA